MARACLLRVAVSAALALACNSDADVVTQAFGVLGKPCRWNKLDVELLLSAGPSSRIAPDVLRREVESALAAWGVQESVHLGDMVKAESGIHEDGRSVVLLHERPDPAPALWQAGETHAATRPYTRNAGEFAEILEADVVVAPSALQWGTAGDQRRLRAVLVHELGHLLGLDHSCVTLRASAEEERPLCSQASASIRASAMYPDPLESGRELVLLPSAGELAFVEQLYPRPKASGRTWIVVLAVGLICAGLAFRWWRS